MAQEVKANKSFTTHAQRRAVAWVAILGTIAALLLSVSTPSCGCSAEDDFVGELNAHGLSGYTLEDGLTARTVEGALSRVYAGSRLDTMIAPSAMRLGDCLRSDRTLKCTYVVASGHLREEQLLVRFLAGADGKIERVQVEEDRRWRWN